MPTPRTGANLAAFLAAEAARTAARRAPADLDWADVYADADRAAEAAAATTAAADLGALYRLGQLYRDADGRMVWRVRDTAGHVLADGIASDHDAAWIAAHIVGVASH